MDGMWCELLREIKLRDRTVNPETLHRMQAYRPELFGEPTAAPLYSVSKAVRDDSGRRSFTLFETLAAGDKDGERETLRYGSVFEATVEEILHRFPDADSTAFDGTDEGKYARNIISMLSGWAKTGDRLSALDILKGANGIGFPMQVDYSRSKEDETISGHLHSLEYAVLYPLLFAAEIGKGARVARCKLCGKLFISIDPNRRYCKRIGGETDFPDLSCEEARKRIASRDSNLRRAVERAIKKVRERPEETGPRDFEKRLDEKLSGLKGNPRRNEELLRWLEQFDNPELVERHADFLEMHLGGNEPYVEK